MSKDASGKPQGHHSHAPGMTMTCRELFERLSEYVDGELSQEICEEIRKHMDGCDPCVAFANTLKKTADLCHRLPSQSMPADVAANLQAFLSRFLHEAK
ncbi:MAG: zf-HC2 domain-containing protein [candidate division NC10 bacterium]|nr:zf-HC2 domain-containing protein [candidate division NC10 bacterium]